MTSPPGSSHSSSPLRVGDLVVIPAEPALGVGRIERLLDIDGAPSVRVLLYARVGFVVRALADVAPCPPGVWPPTATTTPTAS